MIAIIDYDIGNIAAVANMLRRLNVPCIITNLPDEIDRADRIILPGNGSFDACVKNLRNSGLVPVIEHKVLEQGVPLLGICVGAQMLGKGSEEGTEAGLGWLNMKVRRFPDMQGLRIPCMGWNEVRSAKHHYITQYIEPKSRFYFVHSYYMDPVDESDILLFSDYGIEFSAAVSKMNIVGVQFHPEKSHRFGKFLLAAFAKGE
ncbi:MAG: imidazole glycerol phosphate synthase subunit HisH [Azoarcus sp.]|nr:imidazole glycerol phosphate synthase subunit HisH [Azoarcus sp.]